jgi:hypothetical protein
LRFAAGAIRSIALRVASSKSINTCDISSFYIPALYIACPTTWCIRSEGWQRGPTTGPPASPAEVRR